MFKNFHITLFRILLINKTERGKLSKEITKGKEYNYFPRGRVEVNKGRITIFLNPGINNEVVINKVIKEFELQYIDNIRNQIGDEFKTSEDVKNLFENILIEM